MRLTLVAYDLEYPYILHRSIVHTCAMSYAFLRPTSCNLKLNLKLWKLDLLYFTRNCWHNLFIRQTDRTGSVKCTLINTNSTYVQTQIHPIHIHTTHRINTNKQKENIYNNLNGRHSTVRKVVEQTFFLKAKKQHKKIYCIKK